MYPYEDSYDNQCRCHQFCDFLRCARNIPEPVQNQSADGRFVGALIIPCDNSVRHRLASLIDSRERRLNRLFFSYQGLIKKAASLAAINVLPDLICRRGFQFPKRQSGDHFTSIMTIISISHDLSSTSSSCSIRRALVSRRLTAALLIPRLRATPAQSHPSR